MQYLNTLVSEVMWTNLITSETSCSYFTREVKTVGDIVMLFLENDMHEWASILFHGKLSKGKLNFFKPNTNGIKFPLMWKFSMSYTALA